MGAGTIRLGWVSGGENSEGGQLTEKASEPNIILEEIYSNRDCASSTSTISHKGWNYELIYKPLEH